MFDFHRHISSSTKIDNALYNTSSIEEWDYSAKYFSIGILANNLNEKNNFYLDKMEEYLLNNKALHIGEIGLDNRFENIKKQTDFFIQTLKLAYKYDRIFTIHIVKNNDLLLKILRDNKSQLPKHIIYHGFNKSIELAKDLQQFNTTVSINPKIINTKLINNIKELDKIGFLVESDWDKKSDIGYNKYFSSFVNLLEENGASYFKDVNNEFRSILEDF
ncbi:MAG: TatD family hydrolase [Pleomorphochaeta sp.]